MDNNKEKVGDGNDASTSQQEVAASEELLNVSHLSISGDQGDAESAKSDKKDDKDETFTSPFTPPHSSNPINRDELMKERADLFETLSCVYEEVRARLHRYNSSITISNITSVTARIVRIGRLLRDKDPEHELALERSGKILNQLEEDERLKKEDDHRDMMRQRELAESDTRGNIRMTELYEVETRSRARETELEKEQVLKESAIKYKDKPTQSFSNFPNVIATALDPNVTMRPWDGTAMGFNRFERQFREFYLNDPSYTDAKRLMALRNLIGDKGRRIIGNQDNDDQPLESAFRQLREHFCTTYQIRDEVDRKMNDYSPVRSDRDIASLRDFVTFARNAYKSLKSCGSSQEYLRETFFAHLKRKLPFTILKEFVDKHPKSRDATELFEFLRSRIEVFEDLMQDGLQAPVVPRAKVHNVNSGGQSRTKPFNRTKPVYSPNVRSPLRNSNGTAQNASSRGPYVCRLCGQGHNTFFCDYGTPVQRNQIATTKNLCTRCLHSHPGSECKSTFVCPCSGIHSKVLCASGGQRLPPQSTNRQNNGNSPPVLPSTSSISTANQQSGQTIPKSLINHSRPAVTYASSKQVAGVKYSRPETITSHYQTVVVDVKGEKVRVLLDSAAGRSLILEDLATRLNLEHHCNHHLTLGSFDGSSSQDSRRMVKAQLKSLTSEFSLETILCVTPHFDSRPDSISTDLFQKLRDQGCELTDSPDYDQLPIGIILGLEYCRLILPGFVHINEELSLCDTKFGWTITGATEEIHDGPKTTKSVQRKKPPRVHFVQCQSSETSSIESPSNDDDIRLLLSSPSTSLRSAFDSKLEEQYLRGFIESKVRVEDKRYTVGLPWCEPVTMKDNKQVALTRYHRLMRKLNESNQLEMYNNAMEEMVRDFTEPVEEACDSERVYYMPHHPVVRQDKETTKVRIVFDASSHSTDSKSLNDELYKGVVTWDLLKVLLRFRFGRYAMVADIEKAFLRIRVDVKDRDAFRFWWHDKDKNLCIRRFNSVPFGTSASPFLLFATLMHLFAVNRERYPDVVPIIEDSMYVDDLIRAFEDVTPEQMNSLRARSVEMFQSASMNLRKFRTNEPTLDASWADKDAKDDVGVLGGNWNVREDTIAPSIKIDAFLTLNRLTKRQFTSFVQSVYNPTGFVAPFCLLLKFALSELWKMKLKWDEPIPEEDQRPLLALIQEARLVNKMVAPRNVLPDDGSTPELRIYCDASSKALGAVAYVCSSKGNLFLMAKSRLARRATIAELELDALVMAAELRQYLSIVHSFPCVLICGDSLLNLQRLLQHPNKQRCPIALRVNQIKKLAPAATFRHVDSKENMADLVSRGETMTKLLADSRWLNAPNLSPSTPFESTLSAQVFAVQPTTEACSCPRFDTYNFAINSFCYVARLVQRSGKQDRYAQLSEQDLALILLVRIVQHEHFETHLKSVDQDGRVTFEKDSPMLNFTCYVDSLGLLRLRTRLNLSIDFSHDETHPVVLPNHCSFSRLVVSHTHRLSFHPGVDRTCSIIREKYFIINQRRMVKKMVKNCTVCQRVRRRPVNITPGQVPSFRYDVYEPPFTNTGIDIFGPLKASTIDEEHYGVIFCCATSRLVHIELIPNMKTESVFEAMRRFVGRRGLPRMFYSDNGVQFVKLKRELGEFINLVNRQRPDLNYRFKWLHLAAQAPWRGGFYERLNRSIKDAVTVFTLDRKVTGKCIKDKKTGDKKLACRTSGERKLSFLELHTYLTEIEGFINNRPLFYHEGQVIKPIDFFGGRGSMQMPIVGNLPPDYQRPNIIRDFTKYQRRVNTIRKLWKEQYILELRNFHQHKPLTSIPRKFKVGDVVHVKKATTPDTWPLALITEVKTSSDGIIRSVVVRTINNTNVVTEVKDVRNLIPVECNEEQYEVEPEHPATESPTPEPMPSTSRAASKKPRTQKQTLDQMVKLYHKEVVSMQKEADERQAIRTRISGALASGVPRMDKQIQRWMKELYARSTDARCRQMDKLRPSHHQDAEGSSRARVPVGEDVAGFSCISSTSST